MKLFCIGLMAGLTLLACSPKLNNSNTGGNIQYKDNRGNSNLLGICDRGSLLQSPYKEWFTKTYDSYQIDSNTADKLKPLLKQQHFDIYLGTWCGDSRREVPRMLKILDYCDISPSNIRLIMVDNRDSMYKQSPTHEERGKNIHRVPDLIIYSNKNEINRIVESPVVSLEKDMLQIMEHKNYVPQYALANEIFKLLNNNTVNSLMSDKNNIAIRLKNQSKNSAELNSLGYVWMAAGEMNEALFAFELNALLYPNDPNVYDSLGEINLKMNKTSEARKYYQQVLALQPSNENAIKMLEKLK